MTATTQKKVRVPLIGSQLSVFEDLLEENLTMDIFDELKIFQNLQKATPLFEDNEDGYKNKIFEGLIFAKKTKFTIKMGSYMLELETMICKKFLIQLDLDCAQNYQINV